MAIMSVCEKPASCWSGAPRTAHRSSQGCSHREKGSRLVDDSPVSLMSRPAPCVALVTLNRPEALKALNAALFAELNKVLCLIDADEDIGAIVITGSEKAFSGEPLTLHGTASPILMDEQKKLVLISRR